MRITQQTAKIQADDREFLGISFLNTYILFFETFKCRNLSSKSNLIKLEFHIIFFKLKKF